MLSSRHPLPPSSLRAMTASASWDTQPRLPYNPNAPRNPNKKVPVPDSSKLSVSVAEKPPPSGVSSTINVSDILKRRSNKFPIPVVEDNWYLGFERWLPSPPKVEKPRSIYNAASLAYVGDCIYELYARRHFLFPPLRIEEFNDRVMSVVRCEAQDELLQKLLAEDYLSKEEKDVVRWGKNVGTSKTRTKKRAGVAVYNRASSLETLIGYLYLTNVDRLEDVMLRLGFSTGSSSVAEAKEGEREQGHLQRNKSQAVPSVVPEAIYSGT